jgi:hypothetical protein
VVLRTRHIRIVLRRASLLVCCGRIRANTPSAFVFSGGNLRSLKTLCNVSPLCPLHPCFLSTHTKAPCTLTSKPETRNPKPKTLDPDLSPNPKP